jgi:hypothetical protein
VTNNESWYGDKPPHLGQGFSAAETGECRRTAMEILLRIANRADRNESAEEARAFYQVYDKLEAPVRKADVALSVVHVAPEPFRRPRPLLTA